MKEGRMENGGKEGGEEMEKKGKINRRKQSRK